MDSQIDAQSKTDDDKSKREGKRKEWDLSPIGIMVRGVRPPLSFGHLPLAPLGYTSPKFQSAEFTHRVLRKGRLGDEHLPVNGAKIHPSAFILHHCSSGGSIFPGFIKFSGSIVCLMARITASAPAPCCAFIYFCFPIPTPCSPVIVPPTDKAR